MCEKNNTQFLYFLIISHQYPMYLQKRKAVILLLTQFHSDEISSDEKTKRRHEIILHYNKTKGIFMEIIDMTALNAYILFTRKFLD